MADRPDIYSNSNNNAQHNDAMSADMCELLQGLSCAAPSSSSSPKRKTILNRRSVKFPETETELHRYHEGPDVDILAANRKDIWYQYEELKHIKRKALVLSKEAQRYGLGSILTNTYGKTSTETQEALHTWVRNASSRRGLERWINDEYAAKRSDIRKRTIQSVLRAQMKMQESSIQDPDYSMKVLSRLSEAFSVDSKEFARGMGIADEKTSQLSENDTVESEIDASAPPPSILKKSSTLKAPSSVDPLVLRKAPLRLNSPRTVVIPNNRPPNAALRAPPVRSLGLSKESATADFRHFY